MMLTTSELDRVRSLKTAFQTGGPGFDRTPALVRYDEARHWFVCCGHIHSDEWYRKHMNAAHNGRSDCVLHVNRIALRAWMSGHSLADVVAMMTTRDPEEVK